MKAQKATILIGLEVAKLAILWGFYSYSDSISETMLNYPSDAKEWVSYKIPCSETKPLKKCKV